MKDITKTLFNFNVNVRVGYDEKLGLEEVIPEESRVLIVGDSPLAAYIRSLSEDAQVIFCDISDFVKGYIGEKNYESDERKERIKEMSKLYKNFSYVRGNLNSFKEGSFDWVIFDLEDIRAVFEIATDKKLYEIFRSTRKVGRNLAYIFPTKIDLYDDVYYAFEITTNFGINYAQAYEKTLLSGPIEIQKNKEKIGKIVSSLRSAGFREVNILNSPVVRRYPYTSLAQSLFIYGSEDSLWR
jgi:hypothetical protein